MKKNVIKSNKNCTFDQTLLIAAKLTRESVTARCASPPGGLVHLSKPFALVLRVCWNCLAGIPDHHNGSGHDTSKGLRIRLTIMYTYERAKIPRNRNQCELPRTCHWDFMSHFRCKLASRTSSPHIPLLGHLDRVRRCYQCW